MTNTVDRTLQVHLAVRLLPVRLLPVRLLPVRLFSFSFFLAALMGQIGCGSTSSSADGASFQNASGPTAQVSLVKHPTDPIEIEESDIVRLSLDRLYVMNEARGLAVVDVSQPAQPVLTSRLEQLAGASGELYLKDEGLLAVVQDSRLPCHRLAPAQYAGWPSTAVAAIRAPRDNPELVADRCVLGSVVTSRLVGDILYIVTSGGSAAPNTGWIYSLNTADLSQITVVESLDLGGSGYQVHVTDSTLFVAEQVGTLTRLRYVDISSGDGSLVERGSVTVQGAVPSRFHLDAHANMLRVVTHNASPRTTALHVVDVSNPDRLAVLSSLTDIARGEELFASRFTGDRVYVVTYQPEVVVNQVVQAAYDPLWVVSLEDPATPRLLGRLEIPGWSDYVFPRGDLLFAVGRGDDGQRVSASLFDVRDASHPTVLRRLDFGNGRASSEANTDFRAVSIVEQELGDPPLAVVPYSNNYGLGAACVPEDHVQMLELRDRDLVLRGDLKLASRVLRTLPVQGHLYGVTNQSTVAIDVGNRDAPRPIGEATLGAGPSQEACVLSPEAPVQQVTTFVGAGDRQAGVVRCSQARPPAKGSAWSLLFPLALAMGVAGRRRQRPRKENRDGEP